LVRDKPIRRALFGGFFEDVGNFSKAIGTFFEAILLFLPGFRQVRVRTSASDKGAGFGQSVPTK